MGKIIELNKDSVGVTFSANVAGESSDIIEIEVPSTKSYTVFPNSLIKQFLVDAGSANLPDSAEIEMWIEDITGDDTRRLREWQYGRFRTANQASREEQIRLDIPESVLLPELTKIKFKLNSSVVLDPTDVGSDFLLAVDRQG